MATYDAPKSEHQTLSGTTMDTVKLTQWHDRIEVSNKSTTTALYFSQTDGSVTSEKQDSEYVAPGASVIVIALNQPSGVPGNTTTPCHIVYVVGDGNAYGVVGLAGK